MKRPVPWSILETCFAGCMCNTPIRSSTKSNQSFAWLRGRSWLPGYLTRQCSDSHFKSSKASIKTKTTAASLQGKGLVASSTAASLPDKGLAALNRSGEREGDDLYLPKVLRKYEQIPSWQHRLRSSSLVTQYRETPVLHPIPLPPRCSCAFSARWCLGFPFPPAPTSTRSELSGLWWQTRIKSYLRFLTWVVYIHFAVNARFKHQTSHALLEFEVSVTIDSKTQET